eukprot:3972632-Pyramimonas_sp.AAC.1
MNTGIGLRSGSIVVPTVFNVEHADKDDNIGGHHQGNQNVIGDQIWEDLILLYELMNVSSFPAKAGPTYYHYDGSTSTADHVLMSLALHEHTRR